MLTSLERPRCDLPGLAPTQRGPVRPSQALPSSRLLVVVRLSHVGSFAVPFKKSHVLADDELRHHSARLDDCAADAILEMLHRGRTAGSDGAQQSILSARRHLGDE
jgi:hypothetical protein